METSYSPPSVGELVRKNEREFTSGTTQISKYVQHSMHDTLETIDAYLNSKHISGDKDSQGRDKPFFNIVTAAVNIWYRATDIDRKHIRIQATKSTDWIDSFLATVLLRSWMNKTKFGVFLNEWGRTLARYGSAVVKFVEKDGDIHCAVVPWNSIIVDPVNFEANIKIEILELTEAELRGRVNTHGYDKDIVDSLCDARRSRETLDRTKKDNKSEYIKLYEVHGNLPLYNLTGKDSDVTTYVQQMHVISFVGKRNGRKTDYEDYTLVAGREAKDPYMLTHLIKEDGRTLAIGAVEHLFEAQWMMNHSVKAVKDQLDLASKMFFQTSDPNFVGANAITAIENGDILIHGINQPLTQVNNGSHDITGWQNFSAQWKTQANEITGVSEAMLGAQPKSGTAWRQTEALLQESYSLFELMTENKGLAIEDMMRERIIPHLKKKIDTAEEITAVLEQHEIDKIDSLYIKNLSTREVNKHIIEKMMKGEIVTEAEQQVEMARKQSEIRDVLNDLGEQRFFKPSEISDRTWKEQFKDLEWELEVDVTGEAHDTQEALTTLSTALKVMVTPGFDQNPKAQRVVGKILELSGAMSPVEYNSIPSPIMQPPQNGQQQEMPDLSTMAPQQDEQNIKK